MVSRDWFQSTIRNTLVPFTESLPIRFVTFFSWETPNNIDKNHIHISFIAVLGWSRTYIRKWYWFINSNMQMTLFFCLNLCWLNLLASTYVYEWRNTRNTAAKQPTRMTEMYSSKVLWIFFFIITWASFFDHLRSDKTFDAVNPRVFFFFFNLNLILIVYHKHTTNSNSNIQCLTGNV